MADETRHSRALEADIITDPDRLAKQEALNGLKQFDAVLEMVEAFLDPQRQPFKFRLSHLLHLHRVALMGISQYAGNFRPSEIEIHGSKHTPPGAFEVPERIEELCDYVNERWDEKAHFTWLHT
jgi:fido (protein-threonine AMPylation protein)